MIAVAAITFEVPRKSGPPESPKHVPPAPTELFCVSRSQEVLCELKNDVANQRNPSNAKVGDPPPRGVLPVPVALAPGDRAAGGGERERKAGDRGEDEQLLHAEASRSTGVDISLESGP